MTKQKENPYQAVSIPKESLQKIKNHIKEYDYKSIADFIRIAIEERIAIDNDVEGEGVTLYNPKMKPTLSNLQKQMVVMQKEIMELKSRKKKSIF